MIAFINDHREVYGVEPICKMLPIAPLAYHAHAARRGPWQCPGPGQGLAAYPAGPGDGHL